MKWLGWIWRHQSVSVVVLLVACAGGWGFVELADDVFEGETRRFDETVLLAMRVPGDTHDPIGPKWFEETARDFTALGGVAVLVLLSVAVVGFLLLRRKFRAAAVVAVAVAGGQFISFLLKHGFNRPRPDLVPHESFVYTASFPSGHSMMSAVTFLTLGALLVETQKRRRVKFYLLAWAILLTVLVGLSRVYLGVHWPTDVLAGWMAGIVWACLCWLGARWLERRGQVDMTAEPPEGGTE